MKRALVLGAGGHGKVVIATLQANGYHVEAVYDDSPAKWGGNVLGVPIVGPLSESESKADIPAAIGIGDNAVRKRIYERFERSWVQAVHPAATVHASVTLGEGTVVFAGAVIQPDVRIGHQAIVNTAASVDHDCRLDDYAQVAPGARLSGNVHVGESAFLGTGCAVIQSLRIGARSIIGAGAVVVRDIPPDVTAVGVPARVIKTVGSETS